MVFISACQQAWLGFVLSSVHFSPALAQDASSARSSSAKLATFTTVPTEPIGRLTTTTITAATHTVIIAAGKTTAIPVLPDHDHGCYFCPSGVGGLVLSGFTRPGVYPSHTVSGFSSSFPVITIDSAGDPSFQKPSASNSPTTARDKSASTRATSASPTTVGTTHRTSTRSGTETLSPSSNQGNASKTATSHGSISRSSGTAIKSTSRSSFGTGVSSKSRSSFGTGIQSSTRTQSSSRSRSGTGSLTATFTAINTKSESTAHSSTSARFDSSTHSGAVTDTSSSALRTASSSVTATASSRTGTHISGSTVTTSSGNTLGATSSSTHNSTIISTHSSAPSNTHTNTQSDTTTTATSSSTGSKSNGATTPTSTDNKTQTGAKTTSDLPTITVFPTETPKTVTGTTIKSGSKTTETSNGHTTVLPVLPIWGTGSGLCWFCPHSGGGFVLSGFPKPGVYPTGNLPGFPEVAPPITIGPDMLPTFSSEPSDKPTDKPTSNEQTTKTSEHTTTTTSEACSKSVVSDCQVVTSFSVSGSETATKVITSCTPQTGCSVQATTTASATTTTAGGCWQYDMTFGSDDTGFDNSAAKRDDVDSNGHRRIVRRGAAETATEFGSCKIVTDASDPPLTTPAYPGPGNLEAANGASYWYVPTTTVPQGHNCPVVSMTHFANLAALTAQPIMTGVNGGAGAIYKTAKPAPFVNVDHVYELSLLKDFIASIVNSNKFSCNDFNTFFMAKDSSNANDYRLQVILNQLPSNQHPDFAGMDNVVNAIKGNMWNTKMQGLPNVGKGDYPKRIQLANQMAAAAAFVNGADIAKLFKDTNSRIYNAWAGIDELIAKGCAANVPKPDGGNWADAYSTFMTDWLNARNVEITRSIRSIINTNNVNNAQFTSGVDAFKAFYPEAAYGWNAGALFDWTKTPMNIAKRDGDVCSVTPTGSTKSVSATTTPTNSPTTQPSTKPSTTKTTPPTSSPTTSVKTTSVSSSTRSISATSTQPTATSVSTKSSSPTSAPPTSVPSTSKPTTVIAPTTSSAAAASGTPCEGNQIAGSCVQASLPSATPDSGILSPVCNKVDATSNNYVRINADKAQSAATTYCQNLVSGKTVLNADSTSPKAGTQSGAAEDGGMLSLNILFDVDSCDKGTAAADQKVDFGAMGVDTCVMNLYTALATACAQDSTWGDYDKDYTLEGGVWGTSCALWSMSGIKS